VETSDHFFAMVGQLIDSARIGSIAVILDVEGGDVIQGVPSEPASSVRPVEELDDIGYARRVELAGVSVDLADVRRATVVHPGTD
jgi:hypothetical protein